MKHTLLTLVFSTSLTVFSQAKDTTAPMGIPTDSIPENIRKWIDAVKAAPLPEHYTTPEVRATFWTGAVIAPVVKPDTLRAIILATMCRKCAAEAIRGYVVIEQGKRPVYLDCRKRALKGSQVGWGYEIVNANVKLK